MLFYQELEQIIGQCKKFQAAIDEEQLWFTDPYQGKYLAVNELLTLYAQERVAIEELACKDMPTPAHVDLTTARKEYYELEKVIPPFLASDNHYYYALQHYYINCVKLLKEFSYSQFPGDFSKMRKLKEWFGFINNSQEQHDAKGSLATSMDDIKDLGKFENLDEKGIQQLQAEVHNIQTILQENPDLEQELSDEEAELLREAATFVKENEHHVKDLPSLEEKFEYEEPPALEAAAYRCKQLIVQADHFPDNYPNNPDTNHILEFKEYLKNCFDISVPICKDIHAAIIEKMGSFANPEIKRLCRMIHEALEPFTNQKHLEDVYFPVMASGTDIQIGLPDTVQLYDLLAVTVEK